MAGLNKVMLIGNLGKDPEIRVLENGVKVCTFSLATSESFKDRNTGQTTTRTEWHNIVMWRGLAEVAERFLEKGKQVYIEGKIQNRSYQDKEGNQRYISEIVANEMTMLGSKGDSDSGFSSGSAKNKPAEMTSANTPNVQDVGDEEDDLPF